MFCDACGAQLASGGQYCAGCGKAVVPAGVPTSPEAGRALEQSRGSAGTFGAAGSSAGRVQRNLRTLAGLWAISGVLRLAGAACMVMFGTVFWPFLKGWGGTGEWPFGGRWGLEIPFLGGLFSAGVFLGLFGVLHLVLARGLFERAPWARTLGLVIAFLALLRFPLGTALGIYTLWVLLPEESGEDYERLVRRQGQWGSNAVYP